jgi:trimeric autotransporter adhesin
VVNPGATAALGVALTVSGTAPAGLEWTIVYTPAQISAISMTAGPAASAAGKTLYCTSGAGTATCLMAGMNATAIASGVVANLNATLAPGITSASIQISSAMATDPAANGMTLTAAGGTISAPSVSSVTCSPTSLNPSAASSCTVTLTRAAPTGGSAVKLASNNTLLTVPASVTVAAGGTTATFSATAAATVASNQTATVTTTLGATSKTASISLLSGMTVSGLSCTPTSLSQSGVSTCMVTLNQTAPTGGSSVILASNNTMLAAPASVMVAAGTTSANFSATAAASIPTNQSATMTATYGGAAKSATISLMAPVLVSGVTCNPTSLGQSAVSTCTITLNQAARTGGSSVTISSNNALLTVPASVLVAAGASTANFSATAAASITSNQTATITTTLGGGSKTASISLLGPVLVSGVTCNPTSLGQSAVSTCTIALNQAARTGGSSVTVSSNSALLTVPASVLVAAGATSANFSATAAASIASNQTATITTTLGGGSKTASISLLAPGIVSGLSCSPTSLTPGAVSTCTVNFSQAAPAAGYTVTLASSGTWLTVPASAAVASGATTARFNATAAATSAANLSATVTATLLGSSKTVTINSASVPVFIQEKDNQVISGQTSTATFSSPTTAGHLIAVFLIWDNTGVASVSDSLGNTYAAAIAPTRWNNSVFSSQTFYAISRASGTASVTAKFATAIHLFGIIYAHEYSGVHQTAPIDVTMSASGASGSLNSGSVTTTSSNDLLFAGGVSSASVTSAGTGYTARSFAQGNITEDRTVTATGSYSATATHTGQAWGMQLVAFRGAGSAVAPASLSLQSLAMQSSAVQSGATQSSGLRTMTAGKTVSSLLCSPRTVSAGGTVTCELQGAATPMAAPVSLNSSSAQIRIPAVVAARANQSSLSFQAQISPVAKQQSVTITATAGTAQAEDTILLMASAGPALQVPAKQVVKAGAPFSFTVSAADASDLPVHIETSALPAGASFDAATGVFDWTPQARQTGKHQITFTAGNSAGQSSSARVDVEVGAGIPVLTGAASSCSPGGIARLDGTLLATAGSRLADRSAASFDLGGTRVTVNGQPVPVLYSSANRVDFLCPSAAAGTQLSVEVDSVYGASQPLTMGMQDAVPTIIAVDDSPRNQGLISFYGTNYLVMERNFSVAAQPAQPGDRITILATGLGAAVDSLSGTMVVKFGDVHAAVESVQAVPGYAGIYAVQTQVPSAMTFGRIPVALEMMTATGQITGKSASAVFEAVRE